MTIDLPSDKGLAHFHAISKVLDLPEFVKQADFEQQTETKDLPREAFADQLDRKFPIHTKTAAYLSYAYFMRQKDSMTAADLLRCTGGFEKAAKYWELDKDFEQVRKSMAKKADAPALGKFALDLSNDSVTAHGLHYDKHECFFPINTPSEIMKSASQLVDTRERFDYALRSKAAKNIMKAAAEAGLPLTVIPEGVHKMAGFGLTTKTAALMELTRRWDNEKRPSLAEPLHTCIEALSDLKSELLGGEVCEKIAEIIDRYDRTKGIQSFPEDVLFAFTKQAADKIAGNIVTMIDGTSYCVSDLAYTADAFNVLGNDIVKGIKNMDGTLNLTKVAELIDTLPRIDAEILKDALNSMGVKPFTMDKHAMVSMIVSTNQPKTLTTLHPKIEKRSTILQKLEAEDPMIKRALDVLRRLKTAEAEEDEDEDDGKPNTSSASPRGLKGMFMKKAPNETTTEIMK